MITKEEMIARQIGMLIMQNAGLTCELEKAREMLRQSGPTPIQHPLKRPSNGLGETETPPPVSRP